VNDSFIMDHVLERGAFTKQEICKINYFCLYLQAVTVSGMSSANGDSLAPGVGYGVPTLWSGVTKFHKTNQARPDQSMWNLWSRALNLLARPGNSWYVPLHQWIPRPSRQRQLWPVYYDPPLDAILIQKCGQYDRHSGFNNLFL
jgi:hypothetical protein